MRILFTKEEVEVINEIIKDNPPKVNPDSFILFKNIFEEERLFVELTKNDVTTLYNYFKVYGLEPEYIGIPRLSLNEKLNELKFDIDNGRMGWESE